MIFKIIRGYIQLARPVNVLITFVSIPVACWLAGATDGELVKIILAAFTGALVAAGANAINDYFDIDIDRINKPNRPLPAGVLLPRSAWLLWLVTSISCIVVNIFINIVSLGIVLAAVIILYFYSARFKGTILFGNLIVGGMTGMAFIYGGVVVGNVDRSVTPALFAFLTNVSREIVKDIEDIEGDKAQSAHTLPVRLGLFPARSTVTLMMIILVVTTCFVFMSHIYNDLFLACVAPLDIIFVILGIVIWFSSSAKVMHRLSSILKICMAIGLMGIILGSIKL